MKNPSWRAEDGQLLRRLREQAGIDELVFARQNTVSLAQLKELELGGCSSFYNPDIKRSTGVKLLMRLGHHLVMPEPVIEAIEPSEPNMDVPASTRTTPGLQGHLRPAHGPTEPRRRRHVQKMAVGALGLLCLVALTAMKPWGIGALPQPNLQAPTTLILHPKDATPSTLVKQPIVPSVPPAKANDVPLTTTELATVPVKASAPLVATDCDWQHHDNSKTHTPSQPLKPGNYVHLEAQADTELCVLDSQNQKTLLQLKAGMAQSVYGSAPFLVHGQNLHTLKLFFQGRRVHETLDDRQYLLLNSQPL
jgi:hypothetical protein